jgi:hypothetical protein
MLNRQRNHSRAFLAIAVTAAAGLIVFWEFRSQREKQEAFHRMEEKAKALEKQGGPAGGPAAGAAAEKRRELARREVAEGADVARQFFRDVQAGKLADAYAQTSPEYQSRVGRLAFEEMVNRYPELRGDDFPVVVVIVRPGSQLSTLLGTPAKYPNAPSVVIKVGEQDGAAVTDFTVGPPARQ